MADFLVPHGALVLVGDGRKALFLRNDGQLDRPALTVVRVLTHENPPTSEQGSGTPRPRLLQLRRRPQRLRAGGLA